MTEVAGTDDLGRDELIALAKQHADIAANCLERAISDPTAYRGLVKAAGAHGRRLAALAERIMRESGGRRAPAHGLEADASASARLPVLAERCTALDAFLSARRVVPTGRLSRRPDEAGGGE